MKNPKNWLWLLVFGSAWGIMEIVGGEAFFKNNVPRASVWLSVWAIFLLAVARGLVNKPGSSTVIGATATLFKLAYAAPYFCHLLGIFFIGIAFDAAATAWLRREKKTLIPAILTGVVTTYAAYALFAVTITYIAKYGPWVGGGMPKVLNHIFVAGSLAALASLIVVPLGLRIGLGSEPAFGRQPRWVTAGVVVVLAVLWTLGRIIS